MRKTVFLILLLCICGKGLQAQNLTAVAGDSSGVLIFADPRIAILTKKVTHNTAAIYAARGYRVQIYSGSDRVKATNVKVDFMKKFPGVRSYMVYVQPQFRVKIGDYKTRDEAAEMYRRLTPLYSPVMIVPDIVEINTARNNDKRNPE